MNEHAATTKSWVMIRTLGIVSAVSGLLIVVSYQATLPVIKANKALALRQAIFEVIPGARTVVTFQVQDDGTVQSVANQEDRGVFFHAGYGEDKRLLGVAIEGQGQGYQDVIRVLYGYDPHREVIIGFKVLESKETPGLGDKIGKDEGFLAQFKNLYAKLAQGGQVLEHAFELLRGAGGNRQSWHIHAITGATVSSRAVNALLNESTARMLPAVKKNLGKLREGS